MAEDRAMLTRCGTLVALLAVFVVSAALEALAAAAAPARHPHQLVLELAPGTPRPGFDRAVLSGAMPERLASSGLPAIDALNARYAPLVYEPMFAGAVPPPPGAPPDAEDLTRFYLVELPEGASLDAALADYAA